MSVQNTRGFFAWDKSQDRRYDWILLTLEDQSTRHCPFQVGKLGHVHIHFRPLDKQDQLKQVQSPATAKRFIRLSVNFHPRATS